VNCSAPVVAQIMVEANVGILIVSFAIAVDDLEVFSRMCVKQPQAVTLPEIAESFC